MSVFIRLCLQWFLFGVLMLGCATSKPVVVGSSNQIAAAIGEDDDNGNSGYFASAKDCMRRAISKEQIKVSTGAALTMVEVPIAHNAGFFGLCMQYAGHSAPAVDAESFLTVSRACLDESRRAVNPNNAYARCVKRSKIIVETVHDRK
jgi:hypothetical protein